MEKELLTIEHLKKSFGDNVILDDVNLTVKQGEVIVIIGPSGCGKSTLLRCINALEPIQEGQILLDGEKIEPKSKNLTQLRQKIGMVFQSLEYNARFGDPETQPILSMLDTDLMDIFQACVNGTLDQVDIRWKEGAACCIVLASGGYPVQYQSGYPISGLEEAGKLATVFHAGTKGDGNGRILTAGGRVLGVTAVGGSLEKAIETAYAACKPIASPHAGRWRVCPCAGWGRLAI